MEGDEDIIFIKNEPITFQAQNVSNDCEYGTQARIESTPQSQSKNAPLSKWCSYSTKNLIKFYIKEKSAIPNTAQCVKIHGPLFDRISLEMEKNGFSFSPKQCKRRWQYLVAKHRKSVNERDSTKSCKTNPFKYQESMDEIFKENGIPLTSIYFDTFHSDTSEQVSPANLIQTSLDDEPKFDQPNRTAQQDEKQSTMLKGNEELLTCKFGDIFHNDNLPQVLQTKQSQVSQNTDFDYHHTNNSNYQDEEQSTRRIRDIVSELVHASAHTHLDDSDAGMPQFSLESSKRVDSSSPIETSYPSCYEDLMKQVNNILKSPEIMEDRRYTEIVCLLQSVINLISTKSDLNELGTIFQSLEDSLLNNSLNEKFISDFNEFRVELANHFKSLEENQKLRHQEEILLRKSEYEIQKKILKVQEERLELEKKRTLAIAESIIF